MITRIFQVRTKPGKEEAFSDFFHGTAIPLMRETKGVVLVLPGTPRPESPRDFSLVMVWEDLDALRAFVGNDHTTAHVDPAEAELVESRTISHYDLAEPGLRPL